MTVSVQNFPLLFSSKVHHLSFLKIRTHNVVNLSRILNIYYFNTFSFQFLFSRRSFLPLLQVWPGPTKNNSSRFYRLDTIPVTKPMESHTTQQPFYSPLSGTTQVTRYQKKHSPTHHPDHHPMESKLTQYLITYNRKNITFAMLGFSNGGTPNGPSGTTHGIVMFKIHLRRSCNANK